MSKILIKQVSATNKKKDGTEMPNNTLKVGLKTTDKDGNEVWLNGIVEKDAMTFAVGQEVELEITNDEKFGLQFKAPTLANIINAIDNRLRKVEMQLAQNSPVSNDSPKTTDRQEFDFNRGTDPNQAPQISVEDIM